MIRRKIKGEEEVGYSCQRRASRASLGREHVRGFLQRQAEIWGWWLLGSGNSMCKGPVVEAYLAGLWNSEAARVAATL